MPCKNFSHNGVEILKFWPWSEQKSRPYRCFFYASILSSSSKRIFRSSFFEKRRDREMGKSFVRFWVLVPLRLMVQ